MHLFRSYTIKGTNCSYGLLLFSMLDLMCSAPSPTNIHLHLDLLSFTDVPINSSCLCVPLFIGPFGSMLLHWAGDCLPQIESQWHTTKKRIELGMRMAGIDRSCFIYLSVSWWNACFFYFWQIQQICFSTSAITRPVFNASWVWALSKLLTTKHTKCQWGKHNFFKFLTLWLIQYYTNHIFHRLMHW